MGQVTTSPASRAASRWPWLVWLGLLAVVLMARGQTLHDPVTGFDEQFYLLMGHQMLHGTLPYVDMWDRKPVGLFLLYAGAAGIGPYPFVQYKLLAALFVSVTAIGIYTAARRSASGFAAFVAACLYILWLNFMEGEGGQSPVFYNLPMLGAALLTWQALQKRHFGQVLIRGVGAMALVGLALQIKYTVLFEGLFFGCALLFRLWQMRVEPARLMLAGILWIALALLPTALAFGYYAAIGQSEAFLFANIWSIMGRLPDPLSAQIKGLATGLGILLPLGILAVLGWRRARALDFFHVWTLVALGGVLVFGSFLSPHYFIPVLVPLCISLARWVDAPKNGQVVAVSLALLGLVGGQVALAIIIRGKGGAREAAQVAAAAQPHHGGCIWVYDGYPALYMLTGSYVPTRWAFPGHLNAADENRREAIGIAPTQEVRHILATRPEVIVDSAPAYRLGNQETRAILYKTLAHDYKLAVSIQTGYNRYRLIYRLKDK